MSVYVESSAVLSWLLGEPDGRSVRDIIVEERIVVTSELTLVECDRALIRATAIKALTEGEAIRCRATLNGAATQWTLFRVSDEVLERARRPLPHEPIRTLDALHLASALLGGRVIRGLEFLSLDNRLREAARGLGFRILPTYT
jgi:predicted nucleic acid-binding protein